MSDQNNSSPVLVELDGPIATVTIHRPEKLNALNPEVMGGIGDAFASLFGESDLRGVIVTGAGEKAFVAGADISVLATLDPVEMMELGREGQEVFRMIERFPHPVVAAVNGFALGGGFELAMACHLRVASENAQFGLPEVSLGTIPGYGGTLRLARLVGLGRAVELTLTGDRIDAARAEALGVVNRVVPQEELLGASRTLLERIFRNGPVAVRFALEAIYRGQEVSTEEALAAESNLFGLVAATEDLREGMGAFLEKRRPVFKGY